MLLRVVGSSLLLFAALAATPRVLAQAPEAAGENLLRMEGTDRESGIHYLKLILLLRSQETPPDAAAGTLPRFTVECREQAGKRSMHWFLRMEGSANFDFQRPFMPTGDHPYPVPNPSVELAMRFEGYKRSPEFKRQWELLPTGELHYRNAGFRSSNLDDPAYFMTWLTALPNLRIGLAKPTAAQPKALVFSTQALLGLVRKADLCQP